MHARMATRAWAPVPALLLLTLLSCALVGSAVARFLSAAPDVIELGAAAAGARAAAPGSTEAPAGGALARAGGGALFAGDADGEWDGRVVDLTRASYLSPDGSQVTVQSADGDHVVAPGTEGAYEFEVRNVGDVPLSYGLELESEFRVRGDYVPVVVRLSSGGEWLVGGEGEWASPRELVRYEEGGDLAPGEGRAYAFEWRWPFEEADHEALSVANLDGVLAGAEPVAVGTALTATDALDTQTGDEFSADDLTFDLAIRARAEYDVDGGDEGGGAGAGSEPGAAGGAGSVDGRNARLLAARGGGATPGTGDDAWRSVAPLLAAGGLALLAAGAAARRRGRGA